MKKLTIILATISVLTLAILVSYASAAETTRVVTDFAGRTIAITGPVRKIVTTFKPATLCVLSLGLAHKLVGVDTSSKRDRLAKAVFPGIRDISGIGSKTMGINFEALAALKPDLVILYAQKDGLKLAARLRLLDIPSIIILPETFDTIKSSLNLIIQAAGGSDRTTTVDKCMDAIITLVRERVKNIPAKDRKTGYFASARGVFSTATGNMLQNEIFTIAGIHNVSEKLRGYFQDISPEQLVKWNPDIIVLSRHMKKSAARPLYTRALAQIKAVSSRKIYRCPSRLAPWDFPSPLSVLASLWLAEKAYPEQFKDISLKKQVNQYYKSLFGKTMEQMGENLDDTDI
jgi:iron complex transport system substrate-binding protein